MRIYDNRAIVDWDDRADQIAEQTKEMLECGNTKKWLSVLADIIPCRESIHILDVGTGSGFVALLLKELGHNVIGIDLSPAMIQCAYEMAVYQNKRIEYRVMDGATLEFENERFDVVITRDVTRYLEDAHTAYGEWYRVLKKGGLLINFDTSPLEDEEATRPRWDIEQLKSYGFSHCKISMEDKELFSNDGQPLFCITAHKPSSGNRVHDLKLAKLNHHLKVTKQEIQLYQNWCQERSIAYTDYLVLHMVSHHSKGVRPSDIASALVMPRQTLTRILAKLESDLFIVRKINTEDKRSAFIEVTDQGKEKLETIHGKIHEIEQKALSCFTLQELVDFNDFNDRLYAALEQAFEED